ncbi:hypothetical protein C8F01DRAFT_1121386 [Mycena amicta]|nr:hypothetical protein C8F01DRAFT_1121386 [Mycena amicta]
MRMAKNKTIRDYFATNMHITTSGAFSTRSLLSAISELSASRIMFSIDYPYEDGLMEGSTWFDNVPISNPDLLAIGRENAIRLFKLDRAPHNLQPGLSLIGAGSGRIEGCDIPRRGDAPPNGTRNVKA